MGIEAGPNRIDGRDNSASVLAYNRRMIPDVPALAGALFREEVERARAMTDTDRLLAGPRLFERACRVMADGIRHSHPDLDDAGVAALLKNRLGRLRTLERM